MPLFLCNLFIYLMTQKKLMFLAFITIVGFSGVSYLIHLFLIDGSFWLLFNSSYDLLVQIAIGGLVGTVIGFLGWWLTQTNLLKQEVSKYTQMFKGASLNFITITIVSLCAGVGEEIFFRGIIQPYLGVVATAIFFVAIHGYLNPKNWRISIYGFFMTISIVLIGFMSDRLGLIAAISAHFMIDFVLLYKTKFELRKSVFINLLDE